MSGRKSDAPKLAGPYGRVYGPWTDFAAGKKLNGTKQRILEKLCQRMERDSQGRLWASYPREEMARELGVSEKTISNNIEEMKKLGVLAERSKGYSTHASEYYLFPEVDWPDQKKVPRSKEPNRGTGTRKSAEKVPASGVPIRQEEGFLSGLFDRTEDDEGSGKDGKQ